jgi:FKBP-type peptidyl-prolyl cis-trans isomerase FkpA
MGKNKYLAGIGILIVVAGVGTGYYFHFLKHKTNQSALGASLTSYNGYNASGNTMQLNQAAQTPDNSGGLSVTNSTASDGLGQQQQRSNQQSSQSSGSNGSSSTNPFDPSTFSGYNKYANNQSALFGDVQPGTGTALSPGHQATVYYKGWLTNGTLFDESRTDSSGNLQPFTFTEGSHQVIAGWEQGLDGMKAGGVRLLIVPPAVGYGAQGQGSIPPNAVLVFEVQLVSVQ